MGIHQTVGWRMRGCCLPTPETRRPRHARDSPHWVWCSSYPQGELCCSESGSPFQPLQPAWQGRGACLAPESGNKSSKNFYRYKQATYRFRHLLVSVKVHKLPVQCKFRHFQAVHVWIPKSTLNTPATVNSPTDLHPHPVICQIRKVFKY